LEEQTQRGLTFNWVGLLIINNADGWVHKMRGYIELTITHE